MQREWRSEFFQKLSSTATPPKGWTVPNMDEIVDREMKGLTLEEDKLRVEPCGFTDLIHRIFPTLTTILPVDLIARFLHLHKPLKRKVASVGRLVWSPAHFPRLLPSHSKQRNRIVRLLAKQYMT